MKLRIIQLEDSAMKHSAISRVIKNVVPAEIDWVLFEGKDPKQAVDDLMLRESKIENSSLLWEE